jgi:hypothetical protein
MRQHGRMALPQSARLRDGARTDQWLGWLVPGDLTDPGFELSAAVRRSAVTFGAVPPVLTAGPVTLRQPAERAWARGAEAAFTIATGDDAHAGTVGIRILPADPAIGELFLMLPPHSRRRAAGGDAVGLPGGRRGTFTG